MIALPGGTACRYGDVVDGDKGANDAEAERRELHALAARAAMRQGASHDDAVFIADQVYERFVFARSAIRDPRRWVPRVARNLAIDMNRRDPDDRRTDLPLSSPNGKGGRVWQPHEAEISPSLRPRHRAHLGEVLALLTRREQQVLLAAEEDGYTAAEIAVRLGISPDSVSKIIYRARQKIKRRFPDGPDLR